MAWLLFLGIAAFYDLMWGGVTQIITIVGTAAAIIYMVDVRPAVRQYAGSAKRRQQRDRQSDGPYGRW